MTHFTNFVEPLKSSWETLLQPFQVEPELGQNVFFDLVTAYSSAERFYHNLEHIFQVLETIEQMRSLSLNLPSLQLAALSFS
jgi:predicted metal-dependent HD superfamily phosphohydrolase